MRSVSLVAIAARCRVALPTLPLVLLLAGLLAAPTTAQAQTIYGLTALNLVTFSAAAPGSVSSTAINNLPTGQNLVGLDCRPATGDLYALGYNAVLHRAQLHRLNPATALLTPAGPILNLDLGTILDNVGAATPGFDPALDAARLPAAPAPGLASLASGQALTISCLPSFGPAPVAVPLLLTAPLNGSATLAATKRLHLAPGTHVWLHDAVRRTTTDLSLTPTYAFAPSTPAADAARFSLTIAAGAALATAAGSAAAAQLYPNPAHGIATLRLPLAPTTPLALTLRDALGRPIWQGQAPTAATTIPLTGLAPGIYALQIHTPTGTLTQRLTVE